MIWMTQTFRNENITYVLVTVNGCYWGHYLNTINLAIIYPPENIGQNIIEYCIMIMALSSDNGIYYNALEPSDAYTL